jgi:hypothetical protein
VLYQQVVRAAEVRERFLREARAAARPPTESPYRSVPLFLSSNYVPYLALRLTGVVVYAILSTRPS